METIDKIEQNIISELDKRVGKYKQQVCFVATGSWGIRTMREDSDLDCYMLHTGLAEEQLAEIMNSIQESENLKNIKFDDKRFSPLLKDSYFLLDTIVQRLNNDFISNKLTYYIIVLKSRAFWGDESLLKRLKDETAKVPMTLAYLVVYTIQRYINHYLLNFSESKKTSVMKTMIDFKYLNFFISSNSKKISKEWTFHQKTYLYYKTETTNVRSNPISFFKFLLKSI